MAQLKGGQAVIESLRAQGVDTIFGIISTHMMEVYDALYDRQDDIRFISARHEHAAALMADGYARASGKPGVCFTSTGPGAANSMGGIGEAYFASSPVLTITSTAEENLYGRGLGALHEIKDQLGMFQSVTQWNRHIRQPEEIPDRIYEAFESFRTRRPRPIEIEIPVDLQAQVAEIEVPQVRSSALAEADPASVDRAVEMILSARRIAVLAGSGVNRSGASPELSTLVQNLGIPVFTTAEGKGVLPDDHPLCLGVHGPVPGSPRDSVDPLQEFLAGLDTLIVVGSSLSQSKTVARGLKLPSNLIHIDIDPESIGKVYETSLGVVGDAKWVLDQINSAVQGKSSNLEDGFQQECHVLKDRLSEYRRSAMPNETGTMEIIRKAAARDAIFVGDVNVAVYRGANFCLETLEPRTYVTSHWGGLGFGFPAAIGAKAAFPDRQVVCFTGDGGFQFNIQELGTCVQYGLNPVVIVFNDNAWGVLRDVQRRSYKERFIASELRNPDFVRLAESYGANGMRATSATELAGALESALKSDTVTVIDVPTPAGFASFS